jgi:DNA-binding NarL/FixJ family response regulator
VRILIADDHEAVRKGVCTILSSRLDIEICGEAVNGQEAIEKAKELRPDLVILDITMPILGGVEAAKEIRRISPEIPILFLSMHQSNQLVAEAKRLGVQGYINKSHAGNKLIEAVDALLRKETYYAEVV